MPRYLFGLLVVISLAIAGNSADAKEATSHFETVIAPLLKNRCVKCHGPTRQDGKLNLSTATDVARGGESGLAIQPTRLEESLIWQRITSNDMPPDGPLTKAEREIIGRWILDGATGLPTVLNSDNQHWAFRPLRSVAIPKLQNDSVCRNNVDRFLLAELESRGLSLNHEAERATQIRRVSFDLTGLPPTTRELSMYLSDSSEKAYQRMVAAYLDSPHFGERWGKWWLDIAGYAESNGYYDSDTNRPLAYRYRDYVIRCINQDKPFDRFLHEQLAGDELAEMLDGSKHVSQKIELYEATHFLLNAQDGTAETIDDPDEKLLDRRAVLDATVEIMGTALFGLTLQCARCHDHKFEPITQRDYYSLQAVIAPVFDLDHWLVPAERIVELVSPEETAEFEARLKQGKASEADRPGRIAAVRNVAKIAPTVFILQRGERTLPGDKVVPSGLQVLCNSDDSATLQSFGSADASGMSAGQRLAFAKWLTHPQGPPAALLARVYVNRIWQQYFGRGLVATPANLGMSGDAPSHPELLDWLAEQFVKSGWSSKAIHRLILESAAYRQSSQLNTEAYVIDPENHLLWRMPIRRLNAEAIYDGLLAISGELDFKMGGPAASTVRLSGGEVNVIENIAGGKRRAIYIQQRRTQIPTILQVFDAPTLITNSVERACSTIPSQSLTLLNSDFIIHRAEALAKRIALVSELESDARVILAFEMIFSRSPNADELRDSLQFLRLQTRQYQQSSKVPQHRAWNDLCQSLMVSNEFLYLE